MRMRVHPIALRVNVRRVGKPMDPLLRRVNVRPEGCIDRLCRGLGTRDTRRIFRMKKLALVLILGVSALACSKPHKVETAKAPPPAEPAPPPAEQPKVGEQLTLPEQI